MAGDTLEFRCRIDPGSARRVHLWVRCSPGREEATRITWDAEHGRLELDRDRSSLDPSASKGVTGGPWKAARGETLDLRVFLDRSILELDAGDGRMGFTRRLYPTRPDSTGICFQAEGGHAAIVRAEAWDIDPAWPA